MTDEHDITEPDETTDKTQQNKLRSATVDQPPGDGPTYGERTSVTELAYRIDDDPRFNRDLPAPDVPMEPFRTLRDMDPFWGARRLMRKAGYDANGIGQLAVGKARSEEIYEHAQQLWAETNSEDELSAAADGLTDYITEHLATIEGRYWRVVRLIQNLSAHNEPEGIFYDYADRALEQCADDEVSDEYRDKLARRLLGAIGRFWNRFTEEVDRFVDSLPEDVDEDDVPEFWSKDGMLWLDAVAIDWLESEGWNRWPTDADGARETARERFASMTDDAGGGRETLGLWIDPNAEIPVHLRPVEWLCEYLWKEELREQWQRSRNSFPAVTPGVYDNMERVSLRPDRDVETDRERRQLRMFEAGDLVASTSTLPLDSYERLESIISEGTDALRSMTAIRFMTQLIRRCHSRYVAGEQNPTIFQWEGWTDLAEWIGATSNKARERLPKILEAGARWEVQWEDGAAIGLWAPSVTRGEPGAKGGHVPDNIEVRIGKPLAPLWTFEGKSRSVLMPVVKLPDLDTNAKRWMPGQAAFALAVVRELVERRDEIHQHGGAQLTPTTVERIASRVGCPKTTAKRLIQRWTDPQRDEPLFLDAVEAGRYHLADNEQYGKARQFLDETAKRSHRGSKMGKASARKRKQQSD